MDALIDKLSELEDDLFELNPKRINTCKS